MRYYSASIQRFFMLMLAMFFLASCSGENTEGSEGNIICEGGSQVDPSLIYLVDDQSTSIMMTPLGYVEYDSYIKANLSFYINTFAPLILHNGTLEDENEWEPTETREGALMSSLQPPEICFKRDPLDPENHERYTYYLRNSKE